MALAAAEHDEIGAALARHAHDLGLDVAGLDPARRARRARARRPVPSGAVRARSSSSSSICTDGHQCLAHRLDRHELDHVQQLDLGAERARSAAARRPMRGCRRSDRRPAGCDGKPASESSADACSSQLARGRVAVERLRQGVECLGASVSGRAPGSMPQRAICSRLDQAAQRVAQRLAPLAEGGGHDRAEVRADGETRGSGGTVRRTTADQTRGGGWKAPGPTRTGARRAPSGASMTVSRP